MGTESLIILFRYLRLYHCCNVHALSNCPDHVQQQQQCLPSMVSCDRLRLLVGERKLCGNLRPVSLRAAECQCRALCVSSTASLFFFHFLFTILTGQSLSQHCVWCHSLCLSSSSFKTPQFYPHFKCNTTDIFFDIFFFIIFVS